LVTIGRHATMTDDLHGAWALTAAYMGSGDTRHALYGSSPAFPGGDIVGLLEWRREG
jgi:hypothetical protein